jgi:integrase
MDHQLNRTTVAALKLDAGKTDQIFFDSDETGFGFRLRQDGDRLRRSWVVQYRIKGRTRRFKVGDYPTVTADQAREKAKTVRAKVHLGEDPQAEKEGARANGSRTLRTVANQYLEMKELEVQRGQYRASSYRVTKLYLTGQYFAPLHACAVADVTVADIAGRLNTINRNSGTTTAGRARSALSAMFTWAMQQGFMGAKPYNPASVTKSPDDGQTSRDRVLKDAELAAIWRACGDDDYGKVAKLLMLTACRRDEIGGLRWSEIDRDNGTITLPKERTKNNREHVLPITSLAISLLESVKERVGRDHLFGDRSARGFSDWDRAKHDLDSKLKIAPWRLHDLRRSVATWMAEHGNVEPHVIEACLNHHSSRSGVAGIYNRATYSRQMRAALSLWDDHLRSLIQGGRRKVIPFSTAV